MTDLELLKLAAKAAGYDETRTCIDEIFWILTEGGDWHPWNPLADDGDRYRLAMTLGISIDFQDCCAWKRLGNGSLIQEFWGGDCGDEPHAILRAAAALADPQAADGRKS